MFAKIVFALLIPISVFAQGFHGTLPSRTPLPWLRDSLGILVPVPPGKAISFNTTSVTGFIDHQGANSATVTAGVGDSIQVSLTGITATSQIVATYAAATALTDIPTGITNRQTGKFTIRATNGKDVTYWVARK